MLFALSEMRNLRLVIFIFKGAFGVMVMDIYLPVDRKIDGSFIIRIIRQSSCHQRNVRGKTLYAPYIQTDNKYSHELTLKQTIFIRFGEPCRNGLSLRLVM